MSQRLTRPLAELHSHMYGTITSADFLAYVQDRDIDWSEYERFYEATYGQRAGIQEVLERVAVGASGSEEEFHRLFVFADEDAGNFDRFQAKFNTLIVGSAASDFRRGEGTFHAVKEEILFFQRRSMEGDRRLGLGYVEQRMNLGNSYAPQQARELLDAMLTMYGQNDGETYQPRLAVSLDRGDPWPLWEATQDLALSPRGHVLSGVDFCVYEEGFPPRDKRTLFNEVKSFNDRHPERALAILYHVGESFEDKSLESAVRWVHEAAELGAHRLGHAIALGIDPDAYGHHTRSETVSERRHQIEYDLAHADGLRSHGIHVDQVAARSELARLADQPDDATITVQYDADRLEDVRHRQEYAMEQVRLLGAVVEVCPTSNRRIGGIQDADHHPVHRFMDNGVPFVVGSDDAGIFDTTLAKEMGWVIDAAGLGEDAFDELAERSWHYRSEVLTGRATHQG